VPSTFPEGKEPDAVIDDFNELLELLPPLQ
jgi:hypothetical protein